MSRKPCNARSDLANAGKTAKKAPGDPTAASLFDRLRVEYRAVALAERITDAVRDVTDVDVWAERIDSALPPFTDDQAAAAGRLAAVLDARRTSGVVSNA